MTNNTCANCGHKFRARGRYAICRDCGPDISERVTRSKVETAAWWAHELAKKPHCRTAAPTEASLKYSPHERGDPMDKRVPCPAFGCEWRGTLRELAKHREEHEHE